MTALTLTAQRPFEGAWNTWGDTINMRRNWRGVFKAESLWSQVRDRVRQGARKVAQATAHVVDTLADPTVGNPP